MKKKLKKLLINLVILIGCITPNSYAQSFQVTPLQLKQTNLIFNQYDYLTKVDSVNQVLLSKNDSLVRQYEELDSLQILRYNNCEAINSNLVNENSKMKKKVKTATGATIGSCILNIVLIVLICL